MFLRILALTLALVAAACSGSGGPSAPPAPVGDLVIQTQTLNQGNVGYGFAQQLTAAGGQQPYTWSVSSSGDALPPGLQLQPNGSLAGTPSGAAARTVLIVCEGADDSLDVRSLFLEVRDVELTAAAQTVAPNTTMDISASGGQANYQFTLRTNMSGASLNGNEYTAGSESGIDVVRATDADGFFEELAVTVGDDPFIGFQAIWGSTDVWWVNWDVVYDPNPNFGTDFDEVLAALGLRDPSSTDVTGTEADELARLLVIRRTLGWLSQYYGNGDDGNPQQGGLSISFVGPAGPSSGTTPAVGGTQGAAPFRYSSICARYGPSSGVVGTAWVDPNNVSVEHNCGDPNSTSLGIFPNRLLAPYLQAFNNSISFDPVDANDVDSLRRLLRGETPFGVRETAIFDVSDGFGRILAAVVAHEIGHSLGLNHSNPSAGNGDIMNASIRVGRLTQYSFNASHWGILQSDLPGPNR